MNMQARFIFVVALAAVLGMATPAARAQAHEVESGGYVLRASTVSAANLRPSMREEHDIAEGPLIAVLNVTVQRQGDDGAWRNVKAQVDVRARNISGVETPVDLRETVDNGRVAYTGDYRFLPRETLDFRISALPEGSNRPITMQFRDRLGRR